MATTTSQLSITAREHTNEKFYLMAQGHIGAWEACELQVELNKALDSKSALLVLDMSLVNFLSSAGIRVLLGTYKKAPSAGMKFCVACPSEAVKHVLWMSALDEMLLEK